MKILFLHPYGKLGDWNHRLKRQIDLMAQKTDLIELSDHIAPIPGVSIQFRENLRRILNEFKPDIIYVNGFLLGALDELKGRKVVYDMGSFITRNIFIQDYGMNIDEILKLEKRTIESRLFINKRTDFYRKEQKAIENAKAIIIWEGKEAELLDKIFKVKNKTYQISMAFSDIKEESIPFEEKENRIMAVAVKWGDREKNGALLNQIGKEIEIKSIGVGGSWKEFLEHDQLISEMNKSKIIYCPFLAGGCNVIADGLKLGCNVITYKWHPFNVYVNDELRINRKQEMQVFGKAMKQYYSPKKEMLSDGEIVNQILKVCELNG